MAEIPWECRDRFEFSEFLVNESHVTDVGARFPHKVTYHASCHLLRGLGAQYEAKTLLRNMRDFVRTLSGEETCCGFGGVFSVIYLETSQAMMDAKIRSIEASGAQAVVACDVGCLMNIGGGLAKRNSPIRAIHLIEVFAANDGKPTRPAEK